METFQSIAVIGGTGKAGSYLIRELLQRGYYVKLLVRDRKTLSVAHPHLEIVDGNVLEATDIDKLLNNCAAVISTLGMGKSPNPATVFSTSTGHVLQAMAQHGIRRYILITGLNVDAEGDRKNPQAQAATAWMQQNYPDTTADKQREYGLLTASMLDWTLVPLPMIALTDEQPPLKTDLYDCPGNGISAASLAVFLADQLDDTAFFRCAPFVATS